MDAKLSRRNFLWTAAGVSAARNLLYSQEPAAKVLQPIRPFNRNSAVSVIRGEDRRKIVCESLKAIEDRILPDLTRKKYVVIKPNCVSTRKQLAATHADTLRGILDFLAPHFKGPVVIAESSAGNTWDAFENFSYTNVAAEHPSGRVRLVDLNEEAKFEAIPVLDADLHPVPVRLAARLLDPDAYIICAAAMKTHNTVIATLSVKNMALGAPLHNSPKETAKWSDKRNFHGGIRQTHWDILLTAQKLQPFWGATVIDGFEGMEGNGPGGGTPVESRIAVASTDYIAADRVGVEAMGIDPAWLGYLNYCGQCGLGQYDLSKIDIRGERLSTVIKKYRMHDDIERELQWMGTMTALPPKLG